MSKSDIQQIIENVVTNGRGYSRDIFPLEMTVPKTPLELYMHIVLMEISEIKDPILGLELKLMYTEIINSNEELKKKGYKMETYDDVLKAIHLESLARYCHVCSTSFMPITEQPTKPFGMNSPSIGKKLYNNESIEISEKSGILYSI